MPRHDFAGQIGFSFSLLMWRSISPCLSTLLDKRNLFPFALYCVSNFFRRCLRSSIIRNAAHNVAPAIWACFKTKSFSVGVADMASVPFDDITLNFPQTAAAIRACEDALHNI